MSCLRCGGFPSWGNLEKLDEHRRLSKITLSTWCLQICTDDQMTSRGPTALTPITRCMCLSMSQGLGWGMAMATQSLLVVQGWEEMSSEVTSAHPGRELREGKKKRADVQEGIVCLEKGLQKQSSLTAWPLQEWSNVRGIVPMALRHWQAKGIDHLWTFCKAWPHSQTSCHSYFLLTSKMKSLFSQAGLLSHFLDLGHNRIVWSFAVKR